MVLRLSKNGSVQQIDSLPHKKHASRFLALNEAARLAKKYPNAHAFVVLECVGGRYGFVQIDDVSIIRPAPPLLCPVAMPVLGPNDFF